VIEEKEWSDAARWLESARELLKPGAPLAVLLTTDLDDIFDRNGRGVTTSVPAMSHSNAGLRLGNMRYVTRTGLRRSVATAMAHVEKTIRLRPFMAFPLAPVGCVLVVASLACNCAALLRHSEPHPTSISSSVFLLMHASEVVRSVPVA